MARVALASACTPSIEKIEAKYYADGEDAYAMRKQLPKSQRAIELETSKRLAQMMRPSARPAAAAGPPAAAPAAAAAAAPAAAAAAAAAATPEAQSTAAGTTPAPASSESSAEAMQA